MFYSHLARIIFFYSLPLLEPVHYETTTELKWGPGSMPIPLLCKL